MGLTRQQRVGAIMNDVSHLTFRERLSVLRALVFWRAS